MAYPDTGMGRKPPSKLHTPWRGPREVITAEDSHHYVVRNLLDGRKDTYHISALKPFRYDPARIDPKDVARRDDQETMVERVIYHEGDINQKNSMYFKVKFENIPLSDRDDDLIPWKELRNNPKLHEYLTERGMGKHVPKNVEHWEGNADVVAPTPPPLQNTNNSPINPNPTNHNTTQASGLRQLRPPETRKRKAAPVIPDTRLKKQRKKR